MLVVSKCLLKYNLKHSLGRIVIYVKLPSVAIGVILRYLRYSDGDYRCDTETKENSLSSLSVVNLKTHRYAEGMLINMHLGALNWR